MKRHIQKTGVRKFFGQDFVDLQAEPLKALDAFFAEYGACLIEGCAITEADGGTFHVAPGLVALESTDPDSGVVAVRTMPFAGAKGVALPLYLVAQWTVVERAYGDGKVKPIGYNLSAVASGIAPEGPHLVLTDAGGNRFVDAVQDPAHRFITDAERTKWNDILRQAKEYAVAQAQAEAAASQATAVGLAKAHTEGQVAAVRDELALGDQAAVNAAKAYADRIVAALVDNSPELLNTLEELAAALGGDPEFATTVMQAIGERATMGEVNTALAGKAPKEGNKNQVFAAAYFQDGQDLYDPSWPLAGIGYCGNEAGGKTHRHCSPAWFKAQLGLWHSGNFNPADKANVLDLLNYHHHCSGELVVQNSWDDFKQSGTWRIDGWRAGGGHGSGLFDKPSAPPKLNANGQGLLIVDFGGNNQVVHQRVVFSNGQECNRMFYNKAWSSWETNHSTGNLKIIRGAVRADGYSTQHNAFIIAPDGQGIVKVTHNIGHTNYTAVATAYPGGDASRRDNVVTVWIKTDNAVWFVVTDGQGNTNEPTAFDFMIMPL